MAESKIPTNKEIIDELTEELKECNVEETLNKKHSHTEDILDKQESSEEFKVPEDFETETESLPVIPDDFVDEEALRELENKLSEEEKKERQKESTVLKNRGNEEFKCGEHLNSLKTYTEALKICPLVYCNERAVLYSNRAASKIKINRKESAIDDCTKAIELNPNYIRALTRRAKLYEESDKLDESLQDYNKILEIDPGNHEARAAAMRLLPLINERNEKMKEEMLGEIFYFKLLHFNFDYFFLSR